jgi:hypothetical protein
LRETEFWVPHFTPDAIWRAPSASFLRRFPLGDPKFQSLTLCQERLGCVQIICRTGRFVMKMAIFSFRVFLLVIAAPASAQTRAQGSRKKAVVSGKVSEDGKTVIGDHHDLVR